MSKWCMDYETGEYENIEEDGFSIDRGEYTYNWDNSEYLREKEEEEEQENNWLFGNDYDDDEDDF